MNYYGKELFNYRNKKAQELNLALFYFYYFVFICLTR